MVTLDDCRFAIQNFVSNYQTQLTNNFANELLTITKKGSSITIHWLPKFFEANLLELRLLLFNISILIAPDKNLNKRVEMLDKLLTEIGNEIDKRKSVIESLTKS